MYVSTCGTRYKNSVEEILLENSFPRPSCFQPFRSTTKQSHQQFGWLFYPLSRKTWWGLEPYFSAVLYASAISCTPCAHKTAWKSCKIGFNPWSGNSRMPSRVESCVGGIQFSLLKSGETWEGLLISFYEMISVDHNLFSLGFAIGPSSSRKRHSWRLGELCRRSRHSGRVTHVISMTAFGMSKHWKGTWRWVLPRYCIDQVNRMRCADKPCKNSEEPL